MLRFESREVYRRLMTIVFSSIIPYKYQKNPQVKENQSLFMASQL